MKAVLLKKLRNEGRNQINIIKTTFYNGIIVGMSYSYNDMAYKGLFEFGDTESVLKEKASRIYLKSNYTNICVKYAKYSRKFKNH